MYCEFLDNLLKRVDGRYGKRELIQLRYSRTGGYDRRSESERLPSDRYFSTHSFLYEGVCRQSFIKKRVFLSQNPDILRPCTIFIYRQQFIVLCLL